MDKEFIKKLLEQSFLTICLVLSLFFLVNEYKKRNDRNEDILLNRVRDLNKHKDELYERLIDCND